MTYEEPVHRADPDRGAAVNQARLNLHQGHVSLLGDQLPDEADRRRDLARMSVTTARLGHGPTVLQLTRSPADRTRYADPEPGRCGTATQSGYRSLRQLGAEGPVKSCVPSILASCDQQEV